MIFKNRIRQRKKISRAIIRTRREMLDIAMIEIDRERQRVLLENSMEIQRLENIILERESEIKMLHKDYAEEINNLKSELKQHRQHRADMEIQKDILMARNKKLEAIMRPLQRVVGENDAQLKYSELLEKKDNKLKDSV